MTTFRVGDVVVVESPVWTLYREEGLRENVYVHPGDVGVIVDGPDTEGDFEVDLAAFTTPLPHTHPGTEFVAPEGLLPFVVDDDVPALRPRQVIARVLGTLGASVTFVAVFAAILTVIKP